MPTAYSRTPKLLKGALVKISEDFLGPVPNVIVFQYNPETMTRTLTSSNTHLGNGAGKVSRHEPDDPAEKFDLTLILDAADALEEPEKHPIAFVSGVADRIAALEMLLYPAREHLLSKGIYALIGGPSSIVKCGVPVVLFVWGPGRILPVRLTSFSVEEQAYSPTLFPIRASVKVGLEVMTEKAFEKPGYSLTHAEDLGLAAYKFTRGQKEALARASLANTVESILEMLPFDLKI